MCTQCAHRVQHETYTLINSSFGTRTPPIRDAKTGRQFGTPIRDAKSGRQVGTRIHTFTHIHTIFTQLHTYSHNIHTQSHSRDATTHTITHTHTHSGRHIGWVPCIHTLSLLYIYICIYTDIYTTTIITFHRSQLSQQHA